MCVTAIFCLRPDGWAGERIIILAPGAADIVAKLGAGDQVVGVTAHIDHFPAAQKVGSHMGPVIEVMASLKPTLLITTGRFAPEMADRLGARQYVYDPQHLEDILADIRELAEILDKEKEGAALAAGLENLLAGLQPIENPPSVMYETRSNPLSLAKNNSIIKSMLQAAGFHYAYDGVSGMVSVEWLMAHPPDFYIYQIGPMNRNPIPPDQRPGWQNFDPCVWAVSELAFARANTDLFERVVEMNQMLAGKTPCASGKLLYKDGKP